MATCGSEIQTWQCPEHLLLRLHGLFLLYPPESHLHVTCVSISQNDYILYINTVYFPQWVWCKT